MEIWGTFVSEYMYDMQLHFNKILSYYWKIYDLGYRALSYISMLQAVFIIGFSYVNVLVLLLLLRNFFHELLWVINFLIIEFFYQLWFHIPKILFSHNSLYVTKQDTLTNMLLLSKNLKMMLLCEHNCYQTPFETKDDFMNVKSKSMLVCYIINTSI